MFFHITLKTWQVIFLISKICIPFYFKTHQLILLFESFTNMWFYVTSGIGHLGDADLLGYVDFPNIKHLSLYNIPKLHSLISIYQFYKKKILKYWKAVKLTVVDASGFVFFFFLILICIWKSYFFTINPYCQSIPLKWLPDCSFLRKCSPGTKVQITLVCYITHSFK